MIASTHRILDRSFQIDDVQSYCRTAGQVNSLKRGGISALPNGQCRRFELSKIGAILNLAGFDVKETTEAFPYGGHFPFTVYGVPGIMMSRPNMHFFMRWQHHSAHDNLEEVAVEEAAKAVRGVAGTVHALANNPRRPFRRGLPQPLRSQTLRFRARFVRDR